MTTNHNGHALRNLRNRVIPVIDDGDEARAAVETLECAGLADRDLATFEGEEGLRQVDAEGVHGGGVTPRGVAASGGRVTIERIRMAATSGGG